jgi:hypothetical protein
MADITVHRRNLNPLLRTLDVRPVLRVGWEEEGIRNEEQQC